MTNIKKLTFAQACKHEGHDAKKVEASLKKSFDFLTKKDKYAMIAHMMCVIMVKAANRIANGGKEWKPDYTDDNYKYTPRYYYEQKKSGSSGFRSYDYGRWRSDSRVGSRLEFYNYETMRALADNKNYLKLWNTYAL